VSTWLPEDAERWGGRPVARTVAATAPRQRAVFSGVLRSTAARRYAGSWLEAELDDGTGVVTLRWVGRERIPGIVKGASLAVEGTVLDEHGRLVLLNPLYRFVHSSKSW
jgi:hypothetical protein